MVVFGDLALVTEWLVGQGGQDRGRETLKDTAEAGAGCLVLEFGTGQRRENPLTRIT